MPCLDQNESTSSVPFQFDHGKVLHDGPKLLLQAITPRHHSESPLECNQAEASLDGELFGPCSRLREHPQDSNPVPFRCCILGTAIARQFAHKIAQNGEGMEVEHEAVLNRRGPWCPTWRIAFGEILVGLENEGRQLGRHNSVVPERMEQACHSRHDLV